MNQLLNKPSKTITFLIWILWIPAILFCSYLLILIRNGSVLSFVPISMMLIAFQILIRKISIYLENNMLKGNHFVDRIIKQFLYGFLAPLCSIAVLTIVYEKFMDDDTIKNIHIIKELCVIMMFSYVTNVFYLIIYIGRQSVVLTSNVDLNEHYNKKVLVYDNGAYLPLNLMEIALIYQKDQINWLITFTEEEHILELSLNTISEILNVKQFFKVNRNQIVNRDAVHKFRAASFGKIDLMLKINGIETTVSKDRAKDFRKWFYK